jgi:Fungal specific transcription factor domain
VEGLGSPSLQHLLCSNAVHLAQSKGLHRQPDKSWASSPDANLKRSWLWWLVYILEKHLSLSSGRPSAIEDDAISVRLPTVAPHGSTLELESFRIAVRHARICSQISRQLTTVKVNQMSSKELINTVTYFHGQLKQLLEEMPAHLKIGTLARPSQEDHSSTRLTHILYLHFSIYGSLMAIHAHFFYPWMSSRFVAEGQNAVAEAQIASSSSTVAEAARKILLAVRLVTTNVSTPTSVAFYYPIYAHINLFVYILKYPTLSTTKADLGLLDVCAGHFGYIEFLTSSGISISAPRELANLASKVVKATKVKKTENVLMRTTSRHEVQSNTSQTETLHDDNMNFWHLDRNSAGLNEVKNQALLFL